MGAEGKIFGDAEELRDAHNTGPALLRLESGEAATAVLTDCGVGGAADVRIVGVTGARDRTESSI